MPKLTTEEFIKKARDVHGDKYDYSKVDYVDSKTKVLIICKEHGAFWQRASNHLKGVGCPKCELSKINYRIHTDAIKSHLIPSEVTSAQASIILNSIILPFSRCRYWKAMMTGDC